MLNLTKLSLMAAVTAPVPQKDLCAHNQTGDKDGDEHQDTGL
jgi:hypothetical protein